MEYKEALEYLEIMRKFFTDDDAEGEVLKQTYDVAVKTVKKQMQIEDLFNGYDLNRLKELADADKEGRCLVLPCKVGDILYQPTRTLVSKFKVDFIEVSLCNNLFIHTRLISGINMTGKIFKEDNIGKTVFLTKAEAEKTLEGLR